MVPQANSLFSKPIPHSFRTIPFLALSLSDLTELSSTKESKKSSNSETPLHFSSNSPVYPSQSLHCHQYSTSLRPFNQYLQVHP